MPESGSHGVGTVWGPRGGGPASHSEPHVASRTTASAVSAQTLYILVFLDRNVLRQSL